jgi:hypothetical protein
VFPWRAARQGGRKYFLGSTPSLIEDQRFALRGQSPDSAGQLRRPVEMAAVETTMALAAPFGF